MHRDGDSVHISEEEASGGSKEGVVRWVLVIGLLLAVVALSIIWITGAASRSDPDADNANVSRQIQAERARTDHLGAPLPAQTGEDQQTVKNNLPVVEN
jgi:type VI protein secretion system component VasK